MAFLVTGGTGFIGSHLVRRLVEMGCEVVIYDVSPKTAALGEVAGEVDVVRGDVLDVVSLMDTIKGHGVDRIVHLAYLLITESRENPTRALRVNCEGTNNAFEAARLMGMRRVVWASSAAVYGPGDYYPE